MGIVFGLILFAICLIYPAFSIWRSEPTEGISKIKWLAAALFVPIGLVVAFGIVERVWAVFHPPSSEDIVSGWLSVFHSVMNLVLILMPWVILIAFRDKQEDIKKSLAESSQH